MSFIYFFPYVQNCSDEDFGQADYWWTITIVGVLGLVFFFVFVFYLKIKELLKPRIFHEWILRFFKESTMKFCIFYDRILVLVVYYILYGNMNTSEETEDPVGVLFFLSSKMEVCSKNQGIKFWWWNLIGPLSILVRKLLIKKGFKLMIFTFMLHLALSLWLYDIRGRENEVLFLSKIKHLLKSKISHEWI